MKIPIYRIRNTLRTSGLLVTLFGAALAILAGNLNAAISVGPNGSTGNLVFDSFPPVTNWSTATITGGSGDVANPDALDADIQTLLPTAITTPLGETPTITPAITANGIVRWNSALQAIQTPPTGVRYTVLMATLQNDTGLEQPNLTVSFDLGRKDAPGVTVAEEVPAQRVYYNIPGVLEGWTHIPEFDSPTPDAFGSRLANLNLGSWAPGALLHILWVDDNAAADRNNADNEEGGYTIDNFLASTVGVEPPQITQQPADVSVTEAQTIQLSVVASGAGLTYQWYKDNVTLDPSVNPTAAQSALVITNAALSDAGEYSVIVSNPAGDAPSDAATVSVVEDMVPPVFLAAATDPTVLDVFTLQVNEPLCADFFVCGAASTEIFSWQIVSVDGAQDLGINEVTLDAAGTNLTFRTSLGRDPTLTYRIGVVEETIGDRFGNLVPIETSIIVSPSFIFKEGINGYVGTYDAEVHSMASAATPLGNNGVMGMDLDDTGIAQSLVRFDNIFGSGAGQIPLGATIVSASLRLATVDAGSDVTVHRMLISWEEAAVTWDSLGGGVQADGSEARAASDGTAVSAGTTAGTYFGIDVTAGVQAWANGEANLGWALISSGTDGFDASTRESATPPELRVTYTVQPCAAVTITEQPPATLSITEGNLFALSVTAISQGCGASYQWTKNGEDVAGATSPTYSVPSATPADVGTYQVRVSNDFPSSETSTQSVVTVTADLTRPTLTRAVSGIDGISIALTFSKSLNPATAQTLANYAITPALPVNSAVLSNNNTVHLTTAARAFPSAHTLRVANLTDTRQSANAIDPNPIMVRLTSASILHPASANWKYETNSQDGTLTAPATPWYAPSFDDSAWLSGPGIFGLETTAATVARFPAPIGTPLDTNVTQTTYYFRSTIDVPSISADAGFVLCHFVDDGAIIYIDGVETSRYNMTNTATVLFADLAAVTPPDGDADVVCVPINLTPGSHSFAVEVHQVTTTSSDIIFGLELRAVAQSAPLTAGRDALNNVRLSWEADSSWALDGAPAVTGPYAPVAGVVGSSLTVPASTGATNHFYRLRYIGRP